MAQRIALIDHSFHAVTRSNHFLRELLSPQFEIEEIGNDSWRGEQEPDVRHLDEGYAAVVFFQLFSTTMLEQVRCRNIIFVPMYDSSRNDTVGNWELLWIHRVRILNFSSTLHEACTHLGFDSRLVRYYPAPATTFEPPSEVSIFFWERVASVDLDLVLTLVGGAARSLHHHRAPDPGQPDRGTARRRVRELQYTSSRWFADRGEYERRVREKSVYIAPRPFEGIGMSYLEAMAMGKAVVGADSPTMNEYIVNGVNGYLFDLHTPRRIDFRNLAAVSAGAYESVCKGFEAWQRQKGGVIDWIGTPPIHRSSHLFDLCLDFPPLRDTAMVDLASSAVRRREEPQPEQWREPPGGSFWKQVAWFAQFLLRSRGWRMDDLLSSVFWARALSLPFRLVGRRFSRILKSRR
jgi:hypothetical protein